MRVKNLIARVASEVDDSLDDRLVIQWIDSAQLEVAKYYGRIASQTYDAQEGVNYSLPNDHLVTSKLMGSEAQEILDYVVTAEGRIRFPYTGTYTLLYHRVPVLLPPHNSSALETVELEVHPIFNLAIINFCKAEYWDLESGADREEAAFADKFRLKFQTLLFEGVAVLKGRERQVDTMSPSMW